MDVCRSTNSRLRVLRARFSALTPAEVWRAVGTHLGQPDGAAAAAVKLRQEIDLRLGAAFTRFQTQALQDAFDFGEFAREEGKGPMISYGPCQFPTLGFIVQRHWEAQAHMAETTWTVQVSHTAPDGRRAEFNWKVSSDTVQRRNTHGLTARPPAQRGRLYDQRAAAVLYEICCAAPTVSICDVSGSLKKRWAPVRISC
jgi:DNA topoisomerase-3